MTDSEDHELMLQVQAGDTRLLAELFGRHQTSLFNYFRKRGHGRDDSEDLVQETFMRMLRYATSYNKQGRFAPWMYGVARNTGNDAFRAKALQFAGDDLQEPPAPEHEAPHARQAQDEMEQQLGRAMLKLAPAQRDLILLSRVRQISIDELAGMHDCSINAVKVRLHRALEQLRTLFDNTLEPSEKRQAKHEL